VHNESGWYDKLIKKYYHNPQLVNENKQNSWDY